MPRIQLRYLLLAPAAFVPVAAAVATTLGAPASGQQQQQELVLPKKPAAPARPAADGDAPARPRPRGNVAPWIECTICYERNSTIPTGPALDGFHTTYCKVCQKVTRHRDPSRGGGAPDGPLALPSGVPARPGAEPAPEGAAVPVAAADPAPTPDAAARAAASTTFEELARADQMPQPGLDAAVLALRALGEAGLVAARARILSDHPPTLIVAARTLLAGGLEPDREAVVRRLKGPLPNAACTPLIDAFVAADPVAASPALMVALLDHPKNGVRGAALRHLRQARDPALVALLVPALEARRSETRLAAVELLAGQPGDEALDLLLARVADSSAEVATRVVELLAQAPDERVGDELLALAFRESWVLRSQAYALLALIEREDRQIVAILDDGHVEPLLRSLDSRDPFVAGVCAAALAGVGFRSQGATPWLDRDVPERLVAAISGREFHHDYSASRRAVERRLDLIAGQHLGGDRAAWVQWWLVERDGFRARRAWIELAPEDEPALFLSFRRGGAEPLAITLAGPLVEVDVASMAGELVRLDEGQCRELARLLEREGVLGPERLPGERGARGGAERALEVLVHGRGKAFRFGAGTGEPWFERVTAMLESLHEQNRWQRFVAGGLLRPADVAAGATAAGAAEASGDGESEFAREARYFAETHDVLERALRLQALVLAWLARTPLAQRDPGVAELVRLWRRDGLQDARAFEPLCALLAEERFLAERARALFGLALASARATPAPAPADAPTDEPGAIVTGDVTEAAAEDGAERAAGPDDAGPIGREHALELVRVLAQVFGAEAADELLTTYRAAGRDFAREMARADQPLLRAVAASALAESPSEADLALLLELLEDPERPVELAAVAALGAHRVEPARTELLVRARLGDADVRAAALRAIGDLGGELVLDALLLGLAAGEPQLREAAAQGLAELGDVRAVQTLVGLLSADRDSAEYEAGRRGLDRLGDQAEGDLLRVLHSPGHPARREVALLLAQHARPEAVPALLRELAAEEVDPRVVHELGVLTCVDLAADPEAEKGWWAWWDSVVHDDSLAWFLAALQRLDLDPPPAEAFRAADPKPAARYLLGVIAREEPWLVERARRELERLLGRPVPRPPEPGPEREAWIDVARAWVEESAVR